MECIKDDPETAERLPDCLRTATRSRSRVFAAEVKRQRDLPQPKHQGRRAGVEPDAPFECRKPFFRASREGQHDTERSVCIGEVRAYRQGPLGFGLRPLAIAARMECESKAGASFCIAAIE